MGILKKLLLGIAATLAIGFIFVTVLTSMGVSRNNNSIISTIVDQLEVNSTATSKQLSINAQEIEAELKTADQTTKSILLSLYASSNNTLISSLANQIFPMVEGFDFDTPLQVVTQLIKENDAILWVRFNTSEDLSVDNNYEVGSFSQEMGVELYSHEIKNEFSYMKIEMQVNLESLQALDTVSNIFSKINSKNQQTAEVLSNNNKKSLEKAKEYAIQTGIEGKRSLTVQLCVLMIAVMVIICGALGYFIRKSITQPISRTVDMILDMEKGHLMDRLTMTGSDEICLMAQTMDDFADSLQNEIVADLKKLSDGDLTFGIHPRDSEDEIRNALHKVGDDLNKIVTEIMDTTGQIAAGSAQVASSSQALSQGATEQAASLEQITSSMTEMAAQTKTNAKNATQANLLSGDACKSAETGNLQMSTMVEAMGEINDAGQNISKIIKVIDEIAFQTNLLALNAAVEAARAGRHGKGFAVVAEEVRNLAARSAKAAKETAELIEGSVEKTNNGTKIANKTSDSLQEIVTSVTKVTNLVGEIASASNEQAEGIAHVNQGLMQVDQVTKQNTDSAEEGAAAAEELSSQATHLEALMSSFKVTGGTGTLSEPQPALLKPVAGC